ncbi:MAG: hypothetical protein IPM30_08230 [Burkholderiales bacterium]|nr:hypothetical protein [Burkholderiales bacterium]
MSTVIEPVKVSPTRLRGSLQAAGGLLPEKHEMLPAKLKVKEALAVEQKPTSAAAIAAHLNAEALVLIAVSPVFLVLASKY